MASKKKSLNVSQIAILRVCDRNGHFVPRSNLARFEADDLITRGFIEQSDVLPGAYSMTKAGETYLENAVEEAL